MGGIKTDKNYETAYSFIESDFFKDSYDKYYPAFKEKSEYGKDKKSNPKATLSSKSGQMVNQFKKELPKLFAQWKKK